MSQKLDPQYHSIAGPAMPMFSRMSSISSHDSTVANAAPISMFDALSITGGDQKMDATAAKVDELIKRWIFVERGLG